MAATAEPTPGVSRFEYNLLRLARFVLGHMPADVAAPLAFARFSPPPPCLSRACVRLAQDTLAKGLVLHLVRAGGWRRDRFLRNGSPSTGRVWDRIPLDERRLEFGPHPLAFLKWLTAEKPTDAKDPWDAPATELTAADDLFFAVAFDHLRALPDAAAALAGKAAFRRNGLCRLLVPAAFADLEPPPFAAWVTGPRAVFLECLQPALAARWVQTERAKGQQADWTKMRQQGTAEFDALSGFLAAAEAAGRPDQARFVLTAARAVLPENVGPEFWTGSLKDHRPARLADRIETERAALALPRQLETLQRWERAARAVGYFDEEYQSSQVWKADWEAAGGDELATRARAALDRLDPLRAG